MNLNLKLNVVTINRQMSFMDEVWTALISTLLCMVSAQKCYIHCKNCHVYITQNYV